MDPIAPDAAAPVAQPEAPPVISATRDAANRGDFSSFDKAHTAARQGKPLADVAAPPASKPETPGATAAPEKPTDGAPGEPKNRRVSQDYINDRIREAVQQATAPLMTELQQLRTGPARPAAPAQPEGQPAAEKVPDYKRFASMPDAPKIAEFDTLEEHAAAMALFVMDKATGERTAADRKASADAERASTLHVRAEKFGTSLQAAQAADPTFLGSLPRELATARPVSALAPNEPITFANVAVEAAFQSDDPSALLRHLAATPVDVNRIAALPPSQWLPALLRLDGRLGAPASSTPAPAPAAPAAGRGPASPSPVSAAAPPPPTLGKPGMTTDPKADALARGDFSAFHKLDLAEKRAKRATA